MKPVGMRHRDSIVKGGLSRSQKKGLTLTRRQNEILNLLCVDGASNLEIAEQIGISEETVKQHMMDVIDKLGCKSRTEATVLVWKRRCERLKQQLFEAESRQIDILDFSQVPSSLVDGNMAHTDHGEG
jgi:DNA-binding CsgD family transcriptional regulator